jgi:hypothetical protein
MVLRKRTRRIFVQKAQCGFVKDFSVLSVSRQLFFFFFCSGYSLLVPKWFNIVVETFVIGVRCSLR